MILTSNRTEDSMLVREINWTQFKNLMNRLGERAIESRFGRDCLSVRVLGVKKHNISVEWIKGACR